MALEEARSRRLTAVGIPNDLIRKTVAIVGKGRLVTVLEEMLAERVIGGRRSGARRVVTTPDGVV